MKKHTKQLLFGLLTLTLLAGLALFVFAEGAPRSGQCGENLYWNYDDATDTLSIVGSGAMWDYEKDNNIAPWRVFLNTIESLELDSQLTTIGNYAFSGLENLKELNIPSSVETIGLSAFSECTRLKNIEFSINLKTIMDGAFANCFSLEELSFPSSLQEIGVNAFFSCFSLINITFYSDDLIIGECAFMDLPFIDRITFNKKTVIIGDFAIGACEFDLPNQYKDAFINIYINNPCSFDQLPTDIRNALTEYGNPVYMGDIYCYSNSTALEYALKNNMNYHLLDSIITSGQCGDYAYWSFDETTGTLTISGSGAMWDKVDPIWDDYNLSPLIEKIEINEGISSIGSFVFAECKRIETVSFPSTLREIHAYAFYDCVSLENPAFPLALQTIGYGSFVGCYNFTEVTIPESVTEIGKDAFADELFIEKYTIYSKNVVIGEGAIGIQYIPAPDDMTREEWVAYSINNPFKGDGIDPPEYKGTLYCYSGSTAEAYAQQNGMDYVLIDGAQPHTHTPTTYTQPSTCTVPGFTITTCSECGDQLDYAVLPLAPHQYGEWVTVKEPTTTEKGLRERTCTVCGVAKEQEEIPMLTVVTVKDQTTGIEVSFGEDSYDGNVELVVEPQFTGSQYLAQSYTKYEPFNIKTYIDGKEVQPNKPVTVRIPLPAGFDPNNISIYHINSLTGQAERINNVRVENGYIIFTATSFSVYIVVDESSAVQPEPQPDPNMCHWCGKVHEGFFQKIIGLFHNIFARLFGAKY